MVVYEVVPDTTVTSYDLGSMREQTSVAQCRAFCNSKPSQCDGFTWSPAHGGSCTLKMNVDANRQKLLGTDLHVRKGNPSYWWLWVILGVLLVLLFVCMCRGRKK